MKRFASSLFIILIGSLFTTSCSRAQFPPAPGTGTGLPETIEAIDAARVTTRILYITAHPDDERCGSPNVSSPRTACRCGSAFLTRGEGGQNALGPEQAPQLGLIRNCSPPPAATASNSISPAPAISASLRLRKKPKKSGATPLRKIWSA